MGTNIFGASDSAGALAIDSNHIFADNAARDAYFTSHSNEQTVGVFISVGEGYEQWNGTSWVDMTAVVTGPSGTQANTTSNEWQYKLPTTVLSGGVFQYVVGSTTYSTFKTFAVKIVMLSSSTASVPICTDLRVIALQA